MFFDPQLIRIKMRKRGFLNCIEVSLEAHLYNILLECIMVILAVKLIDLSCKHDGRLYEQEPSVETTSKIRVTFSVIFPREEDCFEYVQKIIKSFSS